VEFALQSWSFLGDIFGAKMRLETFTETNTSELWTLHCSEGQLLETFFGAKISLGDIYGEIYP